jgi:hypothetical protein
MLYTHSGQQLNIANFTNQDNVFPSLPSWQILLGSHILFDKGLARQNKTRAEELNGPYIEWTRVSIIWQVSIGGSKRRTRQVERLVRQPDGELCVCGDSVAEVLDGRVLVRHVHSPRHQHRRQHCNNTLSQLQGYTLHNHKARFQDCPKDYNLWKTWQFSMKLSGLSTLRTIIGENFRSSERLPSVKIWSICP